MVARTGIEPVFICKFITLTVNDLHKLEVPVLGNSVHSVGESQIYSKSRITRLLIPSTCLTCLAGSLSCLASDSGPRFTLSCDHVSNLRAYSSNRGFRPKHSLW